MKMIAGEDVGDIGQDLTPQIPPLSSSLFDSFVNSHCSSCFRPLPPLSSQNTTTTTNATLFYCSSSCCSTDSPIHYSSAEHHLLLHLQSHPSTSYHHNTSDLRAALRLLLLLRFPQILLTIPRLAGLLTNFEKFHEKSDEEEEEEEEEFFARIKEGGRLMARARRMRDGRDVEDHDEEGFNVVEEMMALCVVITNAVEVHIDDDGISGAVGIAVYGPDFSWINHSCSPNACYRFSIIGSRDSGASRMRIVGSSGDEFCMQLGEGVSEESSGSNTSELESCSYGPRVIVRSIRPIRKGEEVCVTYTDLLQPKAIRQSELWLRYKFVCQCQRCASTPSYVDHILQESIIPNLEELSDCIDEAISDYLFVGNPESCIKKLENILANSLSEDQSQTQHSLQNPMLRPLHHLSLNAYITLSSAYKVQARNFLASLSEVEILTAFELNRASTAYSLLIAGVVHHLFLSEFSLIATAANFWISVGESLLNLSRSTVWNSILNKRVLDFSPSLLAADGHSKCSIVKLVADLNCQESQSIPTKAEFHEISEGFIHCVSRISSKVWAFLIRGRCYLKDIKDPIDFSWLFDMKSSNLWKPQAISENCTEEEEERIRVFQLSVHCLLYGAYLVSICYGRHCYLYDHVRNLCVEK